MKTALDNSATIVTPKTKIQVDGWGYFAIIADPVGNRIGLYGDKVKSRKRRLQWRELPVFSTIRIYNQFFLPDYFVV